MGQAQTGAGFLLRPRLALHALTAIVSIVVVLTFFNYVVSIENYVRVKPLSVSGAVALSESDLKEMVARGGLRAFWIGPIPHSHYALIATELGEVSISYLSPGADLGVAQKDQLVIQTHTGYRRQDYVTSFHRLGADPSDTHLSNGYGDQIHFIPAIDNRVVMSLKDGSATVSVYDPVPFAALSFSSKLEVIR
ncbi:MAG: hypothetical protein WAU98_01735 [Candidatus Nanopelagicaceae bacterium]